MRVKIIVDSTADLTPQVRRRVRIVPLTIHFGEEEYIDGVTIDSRTFYEKLIESDVLPTTSQASPFVFEEAFRNAVAFRAVEQAGVGLDDGQREVFYHVLGIIAQNLHMISRDGLKEKE